MIAVEQELTVVVPNFNGAAFIGATLDAVAAQARRPAKTIVVDNGSSDNSLEVLAGRPDVELVLLPKNTGFGGAANAGLRAATTPFVAVLNSDARPAPDWLSVLADAPTPDDCWAWGSIQITQAGLIESAGDMLAVDGTSVKFLKGRPLADLPQEPYPILAPPGAALVVRRAAVEALGGWFEPYFLYYEDLDLAVRARYAGYRALVLPGARVSHDLGRSSGGSPRTRRFIARNSLWCFVRTNPDASLRLLRSHLKRGWRDAKRRGYRSAWLSGKAIGLATTPLRLVERRRILATARDRSWSFTEAPPGVTDRAN